ncbi:MAG: amidase family protein [Polyangiaceae bacterium]
MTELLFSHDAVGLSELVRRKEVSPLELVDAAISRIETIDSSIHAVCGRAFEQARLQAQAFVVDTQGSPFAGVPFLVKDVLSYPGLPLSMGSRLFQGNMASLSSPYVERLKSSGLIPLGTTTSSEFGLLGSTETLAHGPTYNPWDLSKSATGSSGGAAAAVAARLTPIAHASDGGGSIRIPASACGVFGFKPSRGRQLPAGPGFAYDLVVEHAVSRSVRDSAHLLSWTANNDAKHLPPLGLVSSPLRRRLRIGFYSKTLLGQHASEDSLDVLKKTIALCESLGHELVETSLPDFDGRQLGSSFFVCAGAALRHVSNMMQGMLGRSIGEADFEPFTLALLAWFDGLPEGSLSRASAYFDQVSSQFRAFLSNFDVLLCPTLPIPTPSIGFLDPKTPFEEIMRRTESLAGFTPIHNIAGVPAMSVPLFSTGAGLPLGSHFAANLGDDSLLLELAYQLEQAAPWASRSPAIAGSPG